MIDISVCQTADQWLFSDIVVCFKFLSKDQSKYVVKILWKIKHAKLILVKVFGTTL